MSPEQLVTRKKSFEKSLNRKGLDLDRPISF